MSALLEVSQLTCGYGPIPVLRDFELEVEAGEIVALAGPNGAGKTTALRCIAGAIRATGGRITIDGRRVDGRRPHVVRRSGLYMIPDDRGVLGGLTVVENLQLRGSRRARRDVTVALESFPELERLRHRRARLLSGGEQQMLALAAARIARPQILLVDELSHGLSPVMVERLQPVLRTMAREHDTAILLVEQRVNLALQLCDRAYVMRRGRVVLAGTAAALGSELEAVEASYLGADVAVHRERNTKNV